MLNITSKQNAQLKQWKKLLTGKGRKQAKQYLIEGIHLLEEAIQSNAKLKYIIYSEKYLQVNQPLKNLKRVEEILLSDSCLSELSQTQNSQGIFAIVEMEDNLKVTSNLKRVLMIDAIQDPGNLGTIIRTADAAAYDLIILGEGTVDLYNDKVIRSTQGSIWHLPIVQGELSDWIEKLKKDQVRIFATALHQEAINYHELDYDGPMALLLGNEANGVSQKLIELSNQSIYIPMPGRAESMNVAVAGGIMMFHFIK